MLAYAHRQPGAARVQWIEGDSSVLGTPAADLVLMTSNVAQVFLDDAEWATTLRHIYTALRPHGRLAFESRSPDDRGWERWNPKTTFARLETPHGPVETWLEVVGVEMGRVHFVGHNLFKNTGRSGRHQHAALSQPQRDQLIAEPCRIYRRAGVRRLAEGSLDPHQPGHDLFVACRK